MKRKIAMTLMLTITLSGLACNRKAKEPDNPTSETDPLRIIAVQCDRIAEGLNAAIDAKRALLKDGLITAEQSNAATQVILKAIRATRELTETAATFDTFDQGKAKLSDLFKAVQDSFNDLTTGGVITGLSETARSKINLALDISREALKVIVPLFT